MRLPKVLLSIRPRAQLWPWKVRQQGPEPVARTRFKDLHPLPKEMQEQLENADGAQGSIHSLG